MYLDKFSYTERYIPHEYIFHAKCASCQKPVDVTLPATGLFNYRKGAHVQIAFPALPPETREMLLSGICPDCWNKLFPPEME